MEKRPLTSKELLASLRSSMESLRVHCDRFRADVENATPPMRFGDPLPDYDLGPIGDMAAQLRKLLGAGQGDLVLHRAATAVGAPAPELGVTAEPTVPRPKYPTIVVNSFEVGSLPDDGEATVPIDDVLDRNCLVIVQREQPPDEVTWRSLIQTVANKDGVHLDVDRPKIWDAINEHAIGGVPTIPFAMYRFSVAVIEAGNPLLAKAGLSPVEVPPHTIAGMKCQGARLVETRKAAKAPRNAPCPCGSGKKFKMCCGSAAAKR